MDVFMSCLFANDIQFLNTLSKMFRNSTTNQNA